MVLVFVLLQIGKKVEKIKKFFKKKYKPYEIGFVCKNNKKVILNNSIKW